MVLEYSKHSPQLVAVDCVIFGYISSQLHVLLYPRSFAPAKGIWSLMGGFIGNDESADEATTRVLSDTIGMTDIYLKQECVFSDPKRDTGARVISIVYYALIRTDLYDKSKAREYAAHWWPITELPELVFDHRRMIEAALNKLQEKANGGLVGDELLPDKFTLLQLRGLYEAILQHPLDAGNFRKRILLLDALERLDEKDFTESRKGAFLYRRKNRQT